MPQGRRCDLQEHFAAVIHLQRRVVELEALA
jgi:hypothetical protein